MKKAFIISIILLIGGISFSQISVTKVNGGSITTKLSMGIVVNNGSSLIREWIILNDQECPIQLKDVGISTVYLASDYRFIASGSLTFKEPVTAYEIHHVLYDVFGGHIKSLSNTQITDMSGTIDVKKSNATWDAYEREVSEYFTCVSYVAVVRTATGVIWRVKPDQIKMELGKIQIEFEEGFNPDTTK